MRLNQPNQHRACKLSEAQRPMYAAHQQRSIKQCIAIFATIFIAVTGLAGFTMQPAAAAISAQAQSPTSPPPQTDNPPTRTAAPLSDPAATPIAASSALTAAPTVETTSQQSLPQSTVTWSKRYVLSTPGMYADAPAIATDSTGVVHVMWSERDPYKRGAAEGDTFMYARFDGRNWTEPRNVLASLGDEGAESPEMAYTPDGFLHLVWGTGGDLSTLMYARAPACCADSASNWSKPIELGLPVNLIPALDVDKQGRLHAAFASLDSGNISYFRSDDSGTTWKLRREIQGKVRVGGEYPSHATIAVDGHGRVHLAWSVLPWPGVFVLYAHSDDGGDTWSDPQIIDRVDTNEFKSINYGPIYVSVYATTSPDGKDRVHLIWDGPPTVERNYIYSDDGGKTWSPRYIALPEITGVGRARFNPLLMDSAGTLHAFAFQLHSSWLGNGWQPTSDTFVTIPGGGAEQESAVVSLGNQLNIAWQDKYGDDQGHPATVSFVYGITSAPRLAPKPLPEIPKEMLHAQPVPPGTVPELLSGPTKPPRLPTPAPTLPPINTDPAQTSRNPMSASLLGVVPSVLILLIAFIVSFARHRRK